MSEGEEVWLKKSSFEGVVVKLSYEADSCSIELSRVFGIGSRRIMARIRLWKEDCMCDLKLQWNYYKSVARIRLVKAEKPSACATVNWEVCRITVALYCL
jgi:hypothetical protein